MRAAILCMALAACGPSQKEAAYAAAVAGVNSFKAIGEQAADLLREECTIAYSRAQTQGDIDELDRKCIPFRTAFRAYRRAQLAASLALQAGSEEDRASALIKIAAAANELRTAVEELSK